jgi:hypothetical protein
MFAEREPWRIAAESACLSSGAVKEGPGIVRIKAINGPGICGAEFPLKVAALGEGTALGYSGEVRPPGLVPGGGAAQPRWPLRRTAPQEPRDRNGIQTDDRPISLDAPSTVEQGRAPEPYDFRKPYGASPPAASPPGSVRPLRGREATYDLSPVPIERRRVLDGPRAAPRAGLPPETGGVGVRSEPLPAIAGEDGPLVGTPRTRGRAAPPPARSQPLPARTQEREPDEPLPPLGPNRNPAVTGSVAPVSVKPAATLACPLVSALEQWIANSVQPAAMRWFGSPVVEIKQISAYSCRGMNGNRHARISEHAFGNALDIAAFTLADGRTITVKNGWRGLPEEQGFLRDVQGAACEQFTTVLAPGSNVYHYDHIHVDLMKRRNGRHACNPRAVSGEEVAARAAGTQYAGRRDTSVTGSLPFKRLVKRPRTERDDDERHERALPLAVPGEDGEDD